MGVGFYSFFHSLTLGQSPYYIVFSLFGLCTNLLSLSSLLGFIQYNQSLLKFQTVCQELSPPFQTSSYTKI